MTTEDEVLEILMSEPETRNSDKKLYIAYLKKQEPKVGKDLTQLSIEQFLKTIDEYKVVSSIESIGRMRRKLQETIPELAAVEKLQGAEGTKSRSSERSTRRERKMEGWIKVHRKTLESPVFDNPKLFKIWMYCLLKATHKGDKVLIGRTEVNLKPGQFIFGRKVAANELNMNESLVYDYFKVLEKMGMISISSNNKYSVITVANWGTYQSDDREIQQQINNKPTTNQQQINTYKNVKNVNNVKNIGFHQIMEGGTDYEGLIFEVITGGNGNT